MTLKENIKAIAPEPILKVYRYVRHPGRIVYKMRELKRLREVERAELSGLPACPDAEQEVIVSLTSYGMRLNTVHLAIRSIMLQTILPNRIVLYLEDPICEKNLSPELLSLQDYGLEIRYGCEDLKPHKKWYYAFMEFPNALIITIDDDLLFPEDTVESLLRYHAIYPESVITRRVHVMNFEDDGSPAPYSTWEKEWQDAFPKPRRLLLATGCGGALYPAAAFNPETIDLDVIKTEALYADDLYLKVLETLNGVRTVYAPNDMNLPFRIKGTQDVALCKVNVDECRNDVIFQALCKRYHLSADDFMD